MALKVGIVVLAAGQSKRFGAANKLTADFGGVPMLRRVVDVAGSTRADDVIVVTGWDEASVRQLLSDAKCRFVFNPDFAQGIGCSISRGVGALPEDISGAMILPGDLAYLERDVLNRLICAFLDSGARAVTFPTNEKGEQKNPVVWPRSLFAKLMGLREDRGGKSLLYEGDVSPVVLKFDDDRLFRDFDTVHELKMSEFRSEPD